VSETCDIAPPQRDLLATRRKSVQASNPKRPKASSDVSEVVSSPEGQQKWLFNVRGETVAVDLNSASFKVGTERYLILESKGKKIRALDTSSVHVEEKQSQQFQVPPVDRVREDGMRFAATFKSYHPLCGSEDFKIWLPEA
jgi:hypothetical protein